jgi:hypothetical protein
MSEELKPCPFCGIIPVRKISGVQIVVCKTDGCTNSGVHFDDNEKWNTRPIEETLRAENERLRAALEWYADEKNWHVNSRGVCYWTNHGHGANRARAALEAQKEG